MSVGSSSSVSEKVEGVLTALMIAVLAVFLGAYLTQRDWWLLAAAFGCLILILLLLTRQRVGTLFKNNWFIGVLALLIGLLVGWGVSSYFNGDPPAAGPPIAGPSPIATSSLPTDDQVKPTETSATATTSNEPRLGQSSSVSPAQPVPGSATSSELKATIIEPAAGSPVPKNGMVAKGRIDGDLDPLQTLWFFVYSPTAGLHFVADDIYPLQDGTWTVTTAQIGSDDPQDVGQPFILEVVAEDEAGTAEIQQTIAAGKVDDGWKVLPGGIVPLATQEVQRM